MKFLEKFLEKDICYPMIPRRLIIEKKNKQNYEVIKVLFPGYVFVCTDMDEHIYHKLIRIPTLIKILGNGTYYSEVSQNEMEPILRLMDESSIIGASKIGIKNSKVYIKEGPLKGMDSLVRKINKRKKRITIGWNLMGEYKEIDLCMELVDLEDE